VCSLPPHAQTVHVTLEEWVGIVRTELDLPPVERAVLLDLARDVAHGVARPAAPLTTFLVGLAAGRAGGTADDVRAAAARVLALIPSPVSEPAGPTPGRPPA